MHMTADFMFLLLRMQPQGSNERGKGAKQTFPKRITFGVLL